MSFPGKIYLIPCALGLMSPRSDRVYVPYSRKKITMRKIKAVTASLLLSLFASTAVYAERSPRTPHPLNGNLNFISSEFPVPPKGKELKKRPLHVTMYEYDSSPLGDRSPFLFVHGLHGEKYPLFRWGKVINKFTGDSRFAEKYKVYLLRYDTTALLKETVPQFRAALTNLYQMTQQRPITIAALSMGGNLVYEGMLDKETDSEVKLVMTLGTPFHGTPLFCENWVKYSMYKNQCFPWTRVDHSVAYDLYFARNSNLLKDLRWDNVDKTVPEVGPFKSKLLFGPRGELTVDRTTNERLLNLDAKSFDKKKLIAYSGYLLNPYMLPNAARFVETGVMAPYTMLFMKVPAHIGREHPVLKLLNKQIGSTVPSRDAADRASTRFVYQLNDGITPVTSALFLPDRVCDSVRRESDIQKLKGQTDVRLARVFRNVDHLTFIDGYRPVRASSEIKDVLNPNEPPKQIFDWMLSDLFSKAEVGDKLAKETKPTELVPSE